MSARVPTASAHAAERGLALTTHAAPLLTRYDVVLCDIWGVVHNGVAAWPGASDALVRFRAAGGAVVLISNAPRPKDVVRGQLDALRVPQQAYDAIVTSGDVTRSMMQERGDAPVFHLGPPRDAALFDDLPARRVGWEEARYVVCSGLLDDETERPEDYRALLGGMRERDLLMICANPDIVVERGDRLLYCAGALAELYEQIGGETAYTGKPYGPIYDRALADASAIRGREAARSRVLAIGDSVRTDAAGARAAGIDCLFVTCGIHGEELGDRDDPDLAKLGRMFAEAGLAPKAVTKRLAW